MEVQFCGREMSVKAQFVRIKALSNRDSQVFWMAVGEAQVVLIVVACLHGVD